VNLAVNARDAMPAVGEIAVTARNVTLKPADTPAGLAGEFVAIAVTDTGRGIAPDVLPKVFDPFFTTKPPDKGSGLGLSQVHGFAHQSGGTVTIASTLGKGTSVTLYLPRAAPDGVAAKDAVRADEAGGGKVLVVEDNPEVAAATRGMLESVGYQVQAVPDAAAALVAVEEQAFDLVMSDIVMPGTMDGVALARTLHQHKPELPVLLVTGYGGPTGPSAAEFTVLRKPYNLAELSQTAARMIARANQPADSNIVRFGNVRPPPR
jgi:CheY-like chemotaxis protein